MKTFLRLAYILMLSMILSCNPGKNNSSSAQNSKVENNGTIIPLSDQIFKEKVYNYEANKNWKYEGKLPCIIDFYADWCRPCRFISPIIEEIAKTYAGKILVYNVNTDYEVKLSIQLDVESLPTVLFIPMKGEPKVCIGVYPKKDYFQYANDLLTGKK